MDQNLVAAALADLPFGSIRYFDRLDSTNNEAARWVEAGAPDMALVIADEQTAGKGRAGRSWLTLPGAALAFSLVLYPLQDEVELLPRLAALGALAIYDTLKSNSALRVEVKWPNDILANRRKLAGVLAEAQWRGSQLASAILGIGINITPASIPEEALPAEALIFPATSLEAELHESVDRLQLLHDVLENLVTRRSRLARPELIRDWELALAFRGEWVQIIPGQPANPGEIGSPQAWECQVLGLHPDGSLKVMARSGETIAVRAGDIRLRPVV
ncbi:MAG: biotin--[acetyl-CoA-carboxylase] ligase [Omnitrophica WOR_2 bacterium]